LAFEEARQWKSYTEKNELSPTILGIILGMFKRLSSNENYGEKMFSHTLGYLAAAKNGLTEDELLDVLSLDAEVLDDFRKSAFHELTGNRLPVVVWSRLHFDTEPYLTGYIADGTMLMTFYHRQFGEAIREEYLTGETKRKRHERLAEYFGHQTLWIDKDGKKTVNLRKVSELPYQQTYADQWDKMEETFCDLRFIEAKCAAGMTYNLIDDYRSALDVMPEFKAEKQRQIEHEKRVRKYIQDLIAFAQGNIRSLDIIQSSVLKSEEEIRKDTERISNNPTRLERMQAFYHFVNSESHLLTRFASYPGFCIQQAYNYTGSGIVACAAESIVSCEANCVLLLHLPINRPKYIFRPALVRTLKGHTKNVTCIDMTPDGKLAISGSRDRTLRVWNLQDGECLRTLEGHTDEVTSVSITPDGKLAISGGDDNALRVWDLELWECVRTLRGHNHHLRANGVCVTSDGRMAVSLSNDGIFRVWDLERYTCRAFNTNDDSAYSRYFAKGLVTRVCITPDGRIALSKSTGGALSMWNLETGKRLKMLIGHTSPVTCVYVTPGGRIAISGSDDNTLRLWDLERGKCLRILEGHTGRITSVSLTPDCRLVFSGSDDGNLRIWDLTSGIHRTIAKNHGSINILCVTPDGRLAVSGTDNGMLQVWNLENGDSHRSSDHLSSVSSLRMTGDGERIVSVAGSALQVWDPRLGVCLKKFETHTHDIHSFLAVTPDNKSAISGGHDDTFREGPRSLLVWNLRNGKCVERLEGHMNWISDIHITLDGRLAVSGSIDGTLRVWDLENGKCLKTLEGYQGWVMCVCITPDGRLAVSGGTYGTLCVWDLHKGVCLRTLKGHTDFVRKVCVTPDGRMFVSASDDSTLRLWNAKSGKCLEILEGHTGRIMGLCVTPDGMSAISGGEDQTLRVWDLITGECIAVYPTRSPINSISGINVEGYLAFSEDEKGPIFLQCRNLMLDAK
jgi:WD40 repeat protein